MEWRGHEPRRAWRGSPLASCSASTSNKPMEKAMSKTNTKNMPVSTDQIFATIVVRRILISSVVVGLFASPEGIVYARQVRGRAEVSVKPRPTTSTAQRSAQSHPQCGAGHNTTINRGACERTSGTRLCNDFCEADQSWGMSCGWGRACNPEAHCCELIRRGGAW